MITLVDDIIRLSRLDEGELQFQREDVDLYDLVSDTLDSLRSSAEQKDVHLELSGEHAAVRGVWQLLDEAVFNLCDNAIKYNVAGGTVTAEVAKGENGEIRLSVSDTGIGIPPEHQDRVFERFYRVDKSHSKAIGGTGLGLSIVKHVAQFHDAELKLESSPDAGTRITLIFPAEQACDPDRA
jgi:two-component system phosphate regulon sensor histidine kinase PhoR